MVVGDGDKLITDELINSRMSALISLESVDYINDEINKNSSNAHVYSLSHEELEEFGRDQVWRGLKELMGGEALTLDYDVYISKIIEHHRRIHGNLPKMKRRGASVEMGEDKSRHERERRHRDTNMEEAVIKSVGKIVFVTMTIIICCNLILRAVVYLFSFTVTKLNMVKIIFGLVIFGLIVANSYFIGYKKHIVGSYCSIGFKEEKRYAGHRETKFYMILFSLCLLFPLFRHVVNPGIFRFTNSLDFSSETSLIVHLSDPLFFIFNGLLACWSGYTFEKHKRLNDNTLYNIIVSDADIEFDVSDKVVGDLEGMDRKGMKGVGDNVLFSRPNFSFSRGLSLGDDNLDLILSRLKEVLSIDEICRLIEIAHSDDESKMDTLIKMMGEIGFMESEYKDVIEWLGSRSCELRGDGIKHIVYKFSGGVKDSGDKDLGGDEDNFIYSMLKVVGYICVICGIQIIYTIILTTSFFYILSSRVSGRDDGGSSIGCFAVG